MTAATPTPTPPTSPALTTVLLDLDGVLRHFDPEHVSTVEERHAMTPGTLQSTAFESGLIEDVVTGKLTRAAWREEIGRRVGNAQAAQEWLAARGTVDEAMLVEVDALRSRGTTVAVLTNGTDETATEVVDLGIVDRVDFVFNTAEIGYAKPDIRAFQSVCTGLGVAAEEVFFTDDSESKLVGAVTLGMTARHFTNIDTFRAHLTDFGLRPL